MRGKDSFIELDTRVFCLPIDLDSYFSTSAFGACRHVFCDDADQLLALKEQGRFVSLQHIDGDYGQLLTGQVAKRSSSNQFIMAISVGIALGDLAVAQLLYEKAVETGKGHLVEL